MKRRDLIKAAKAAMCEFRVGSQKQRVYKRLLFSLLNGREVKNYHFAQMRILSYTKRVSEIRDKINVYGITITATPDNDNGLMCGPFTYTIEAL